MHVMSISHAGICARMHVCVSGCSSVSVHACVCAWTSSPSTYMANLRAEILNFRGFDSSMILIVRGGILMSMGELGNSRKSLVKQS